MRLTRRTFLRASGTLAGVGVAGVGTAAARDPVTPTPPKEAYQPSSSKNWWYSNAHLYDGRTPRYNLSVALVMDHGGDAAGHLLLFTLVDYETGETVGENHEGVITPNPETYGAHYRGESNAVRLERVAGTAGGPGEFVLSVAGEHDVRLRFRADDVPRTREDYREGGGVANVLFWNQVRCEGRVGDTGVTGVGFLEHVWGTWSRVPQKGIDFVNAHLGRPGRGNDPPTDASVYFRRTFYHGTPVSGPVLADVGPVLFLTPDGETWYVADTIECSADGEPCEDHRTDTPDHLRIAGTFAEDGRVDLRLDQRPHATISIPEVEPLGNVHEGAAEVRGMLRLPDRNGPRPVEGIAQTEHQRFAPFYEF